MKTCNYSGDKSAGNPGFFREHLPGCPDCLAEFEKNSDLPRMIRQEMESAEEKRYFEQLEDRILIRVSGKRVNRGVSGGKIRYAVAASVLVLAGSTILFRFMSSAGPDIPDIAVSQILPASHDLIEEDDVMAVYSVTDDELDEITRLTGADELTSDGIPELSEQEIETYFQDIQKERTGS
ncbi:MAG: hypothetical protein L6Q77_05970 [Bacteroidetes bacterium]|nr:hypothetical protein [Bacteroidota bacterium]